MWAVILISNLVWGQKSIGFVVHYIRCTRKYLSTESTKNLVHALVTIVELTLAASALYN